MEERKGEEWRGVKGSSGGEGMRGGNERSEREGREECKGGKRRSEGEGMRNSPCAHQRHSTCAH